MTCDVENRDGVVRIRGEMTIYGAAELKGSLFTAISSHPEHCSIDLASVSEFDTTGLQILMMAQRACASRGAHLRVENPSDCVREAFALLHATDFFSASSGK